MSTNIMFNDFYEENAMPKWYFDVAFLFHDNAGAGFDTSESQYSKNYLYSELLSKAVTNIKMPELRNDKLVTYLPGFHFAYPGKPGLNGELSLVFNDDSHLTIRRIANYLQQYNYNPRYQQHDFFDEGADNYLSLVHTVIGDVGKPFIISPKFDIYVRIYDCFGKFVQKIVYKNCFVKTIGSLDLDYSSEEIVTTQVSICYPYFKVLNPSEIDSEFDYAINHEPPPPKPAEMEEPNDTPEVNESTVNNTELASEDLPANVKAEPLPNEEQPEQTVNTPPEQPQENVEETTPAPLQSTEDLLTEQNEQTPVPPKEEPQTEDTGVITNPILEPEPEPEKPEPEQKAKALPPEEPKTEALETKPEVSKDPTMEQVISVLNKNEGSRDYVYVNHHSVKSDVPTIGLGLTFKYALADEDVTLTNDKGEKVTKKGSEWQKYFEGKGYDALPTGNGKNNGGTATTEKWSADSAELQRLAEKKVGTYEAAAKKTSKKKCLNWDELSAEEKALMIDSSWNGTGSSAADTISYARKNNKSLSDKEVQDHYGELEYQRKKQNMLKAGKDAKTAEQQAGWARSNASRRVANVANIV